MRLTNFSIADGKMQQLLSGFVGSDENVESVVESKEIQKAESDDFEPIDFTNYFEDNDITKAFDNLFDSSLEKGVTGRKLDTSKLTLKEVSVNGKMQHRWVNPNKNDAEFAPHGSRVTFMHNGKEIGGKVGDTRYLSKPKTHLYDIHADDGKKYIKFHHQITGVEGSEGAEPAEEVGKSKTATPKPTETKKKLPEGVETKEDIKKYANARSTKELLGMLTEKDTHPDLVDRIKKVLDYRDVDYKDAIAAGGHEPKQAEGGNSASTGGSAPAPAAEAQAKKVEQGSKLKGEWFHDINKRFQVYEDLADDVINGHGVRSLLVYGSGGVGKSYTVQQVLDKSGKVGFDPNKHTPGSDDYDYVIIKGGKMTPTGLYKNLYQHNEKLIILDDNDNIFKDQTALNMLKGALDTKDRRVSNETNSPLKDSDGEPIPTSFKYNGKMIAITNLKTDDSKLQPLKSRSSKIDMTMTPDQTLDRIEHIGTDKNGKLTKLDFTDEDDPSSKNFKYTHEDAKAVLDFMRKNKNEFGDDLSVRTIKTLISLKHKADKRGIDPESYMETHLLSKAEKNNLEKAFNNFLQ